MTVLVSGHLWAEFEQARDHPELLVDAGRAYSKWFQQRCKEGTDPSRLERDSLDLDEKIAARSLPGVGGCLIWDGPMSRWNTPICNHEGSRVSVRKRLLVGSGLVAPSRRRILARCGRASCVNVKHLFWDEEPWGRLNNNDVILGRIKMLALRLGHPPSSMEWQESGLCPQRKVVSARFGGWGGALRRAGFDVVVRPGPKRLPVTDEQLLEAIREFKGTHGRPPTYSEAERCLPMSAQGYAYRFGRPWTQIRDSA